ADFSDHQLGRDHVTAPEKWSQNQQKIGLVENSGGNAALFVGLRLCHRRLGDVRTIGLISYSVAIKPERDVIERANVRNLGKGAASTAGSMSSCRISARLKLGKTGLWRMWLSSAL